MLSKLSVVLAKMIVATLALVSATGCSTLTQTEIKFLETRELDLPYDAGYEAALNAMFSIGLVITHSDKHSGVITGQSGDHALRASVGALRRRLYPVKKVSLMLSPRGKNITQLRMKVLVNEKQRLDRKLMTGLWQRIEREAMLETRPAGPRPARQSVNTRSLREPSRSPPSQRRRVRDRR